MTALRRPCTFHHNGVRCRCDDYQFDIALAAANFIQNRFRDAGEAKLPLRVCTCKHHANDHLNETSQQATQNAVSEILSRVQEALPDTKFEEIEIEIQSDGEESMAGTASVGAGISGGVQPGVQAEVSGSVAEGRKNSHGITFRARAASGSGNGADADAGTTGSGSGSGGQPTINDGPSAAGEGGGGGGGGNDGSRPIVGDHTGGGGGGGPSSGIQSAFPNTAVSGGNGGQASVNHSIGAAGGRGSGGGGGGGAGGPTSSGTQSAFPNNTWLGNIAVQPQKMEFTESGGRGQEVDFPVVATLLDMAGNVMNEAPRDYQLPTVVEDKDILMLITQARLNGRPCPHTMMALTQVTDANVMAGYKKSWKTHNSQSIKQSTFNVGLQLPAGCCLGIGFNQQSASRDDKADGLVRCALVGRTLSYWRKTCQTCQWSEPLPSMEEAGAIFHEALESGTQPARAKDLGLTVFAGTEDEVHYAAKADFERKVAKARAGQRTMTVGAEHASNQSEVSLHRTTTSGYSAPSPAPAPATSPPSPGAKEKPLLKLIGELMEGLEVESKPAAAAMDEIMNILGLLNEGNLKSRAHAAATELGISIFTE